MSDKDDRDGLIGKPTERNPLQHEPICRYRDLLPLTAEIISALLTKDDRNALAEQVLDLMIFDRCSCEAAHCASFYTQPKPDSRYGATHWGFMLPSPTGLMIFDLLGDTIAFIEVLGFPLASAEVAKNWSKYRTR
jgi:hypothetical protein